ncbi:MAG: glycosyltransferase [Acidimicrobiales bacterium]
MSAPRLVALAASAGTSARAVPLLTVVGRWCTVASWHRLGSRRADAVVATTVEALAATGPAGQALPSACWVRTADEGAEAQRLGAVLLLTARPDLVDAGAVLVPPVGIEVDRWPVVAPLVRRRTREARSLPDLHVVRPAPGAAIEDVADDLACCSAAVVGGPATLVALALGAPTITSGDTARRLGLRPGRDVEVASSPDAALALAREVGGDEERAALLSRRGRRCAEHHLDLGAPARRVTAALGVRPMAEGPVGVLDERLDELGTPPGARIRARASVALAGLGDGGGGSHP